MLVQTNLEQLESGSTNWVGTAYCSLCGEAIGVIDQDELKFLIYECDSEVLCFECEDLHPPRSKELPARMRKNLLSMYKTEKEEELPLHVAPMWITSDERGVLALCPNVGWLAWKADRDGNVRLCRTKMGSEEASAIKEVLAMRPCLQVKTLVL